MTALAALPLAAANAVESTSAWTCTTKSGLDSKFVTRVCTSPAIASPTTSTQGLQLVSCDANARVYWKSSAAASSSVTVVVGPNTAISATAGVAGTAAATAATTVASATIPGGTACYIWGDKTNVAGATETTTFYTVEQTNQFRVSKPW